MKKLTKDIYVCDICGHQSTDESIIRQCENSHVSPQSMVTEMKCYKHFMNYPDYINILFENGKKIRYDKHSTL